MAATTITAIGNRIEAVLEAAPLSLKKTTDAFSHDRQPNTSIDNAYRLQDGGLVSTKSATNMAAVRVDRLTIFIARKRKFGGRAPVESIQDDLNTIERYVKADGLSGSYHAELSGRKITPSGDSVVGSIDVTVDYDFNEATV